MTPGLLAEDATIQLSVRGVRTLPHPCSCTWRLRLGNEQATWSLVKTDTACPKHGQSSSDERWEL